jgi:hypothetical protein
MSRFSAYFIRFVLVGAAGGAALGHASVADAPRAWEMPPRAEWSSDATGERADLVNLYIHADEQTLWRALEEAGWSQAAARTFKNKVRYLGAAARSIPQRGWGARSRAIRTMPVTNLYYRGSRQVRAYQAGNKAFGGRHHFRVHSTGQVDPEGLPVWAIAATEDVGLRLRPAAWHQLFLDHAVNPNADVERDYLLRSLLESKAVQLGCRVDWEKRELNPGEPARRTRLTSVDHVVYELTIRPR